MGRPRIGEADMGAFRKLARHSIGHHKSGRVERIPFGYTIKMSDALVEVAQPMIEEAQNEEQFRLVIGFAAMCWNLSLLPADLRPAHTEDMIRELVPPGQPMDDMQEVVRLLIARKEALFPDDKRLITTYQVSGSRGNANIVVEYSPPAQK
jgi:hypothetical protein